MSIILSIRKFFRLDNSTLVLNSEFTDTVGLWITEKDELMKEVHYGGCFGHTNNSHNNHDSILANQTTDTGPFTHDLHFHF